MRIIYKTNDGVNVLIPSPNWSGTLEELAKKDVPNGVDYKIVSDSEIPNDRTLRNAWEVDTNFKISENLDKAKEITKDRLRAERKPLLESEDIKFMQAQETGADTKDIVAEKQRLRDITKKADTCKTTDELKALTVEK
jgi:hypothetical protein